MNNEQLKLNKMEKYDEIISLAEIKLKEFENDSIYNSDISPCLDNVKKYLKIET